MIKAAIFDMDGTLVDNMHYHRESWLTFLAGYDIHLSRKDFYRYNGGTLPQIIQRFFGDDLPDQEIHRLGQEKEQAYRALYRPHVEAIDGLRELLDELQELHIQQALATMGDQPNIDFILYELDIRDYFEVITGGHEVTLGKPNPEIFEKTLKRLHIQPNDAMVFEDSPSGIKAARSIGIPVVALATTHTREKLAPLGCRQIITNFTEFDRSLLQSVR